MSGWKAKRFWKEVTTVQDGAGWGVRLDGRAVKTPAKSALIVPTEAMAKAIAAEWDAQQGEVRPDSMPVTRSANSAIDKVTPQFDAIVEMLGEYGGSDLLCYRADAPEELVARQNAHWDPLLAWAEAELAAPLRMTVGVVPVAQDAESLAHMTGALWAYDPFQMVALHDLIAISGSLVIGLAIAKGRITPDEGWLASRVDEMWQAEVWGADEEADATEAVKKRDLAQAALFLDMCR